VRSLSQNAQFLDQRLERRVAGLLAFLDDVVFAAFYAAIDQQASILAGELGLFPVTLASLLVVLVGVQNGLLVVLALVIAGGRRCLADVQQAREVLFDFSIADDVSRSSQNRLSLGFVLSVGRLVARADATADRGQFVANLVEFLRRQIRNDRS